MKTSAKMHLLPLEAYTSQEWYDREQKKIFSNTWRFAGLVEDISEVGQYVCVQAGLNNIFIVMGPDQQLRAFHNLCRHRGTQLLRTIGKTKKSITCPYHDWSYNLQGALIAVPEQKTEFPQLDKACLGLKSASVGAWRGMLFVHPSPEATPLQDWFGPVEAYLGPHEVESLVEYPEAATQKEIRANWKIVVENYIDHYHLSHLHSGTLSMYDHKQAKFGFVGPHFAFWEPLAKNYLKDIQENAPMPLILEPEQLGTWVPMLFPGLGLAESESSWSTFSIIPLGPELTRVETRTKVKNASNWEFTKQEWRSSSFWQKNIRGKYPVREDSSEDDPMLSGDFMAEDIYACEQQQKALKSPYFEVGATAQRGEQPVMEHQKIVGRYMQD